MRQQLSGDSDIYQADIDRMGKRLFLLLDHAVHEVEENRFGPNVESTTTVLNLARAYREIKP